MKPVVSVVTKHFEHGFDNGGIYHETHVDDIFHNAYFTKKKPTEFEKDKIYIYSPKLLKACLTHCWFHITTRKGDYEEEGSVDKQDWICPQIDTETFDDWENVVCFNGREDGSTWTILYDTPRSVPIRQDYIGGFTNKNFDLDKVEAHLKKHDWVLSVERQEIPSYNSDFPGHEAIEFVVQFPQNKFNELFYKSNKGKGKYPHWSVVLTSFLNSHPSEEDPLDLQQFRTKKDDYE
jgi:hypothetical protein